MLYLFINLYSNWHNLRILTGKTSPYTPLSKQVDTSNAFKCDARLVTIAIRKSTQRGVPQKGVSFSKLIWLQNFKNCPIATKI